MKKVKALKPFIHYEALKRWEIATFLIYASITLYIIWLCFEGGNKIQNETVFGYAVFTQTCLYILLYVSLRNFTSYLIWVCFGVVHLVMYLAFKDSQGLQGHKADLFAALANTLPLLLLFQFLRYFSIKIQGREFVVPEKNSDTDLIENKKVSSVDSVICIIYIISLIGSAFLMT
ncbi:hypothetical protein ACFJIV_30210 [Mucilaginibacter sp. UC70_90]